MSERKISKLKLHNFKCHSTFEQQLSNITILAGGNAAGKSSVIQSILLANAAWNNVDKKRVYTNNVEGIYMGPPSAIISEEHDNDKIAIDIQINNYANSIELTLPSAEEDGIYFDINNYEEICEKSQADACVLNKMHVFYINAERFGPRVISGIENAREFYVGSHGENTDYVISKMDLEQKNKPLKLKLPEALQASSIMRFSANVEEWLNIIIPDTKIETSMNTEFGISTIKFQNTGENFYLPTATGFGITYILPIITQALIASMLHNCVLLVENPEAHLHPYSQSMIGRFLAYVSAQGVQVIIETHSEHVINGCRLQLGELKKCDTATILFFNREKDRQIVKEIRINEFGELEEWPKGFFDQAQNDLRKILELRLCQK